MCKNPKVMPRSLVVSTILWVTDNVSVVVFQELLIFHNALLATPWLVVELQ